jgi:hypothetical protein
MKIRNAGESDRTHTRSNSIRYCDARDLKQKRNKNEIGK